MTLLASLRDWLKAQQLDAVLLSSRQNKQPHLGISTGSGYVLISRESAHILVDSRYYADVEAHTGATNCICLMRRTRLQPSSGKSLPMSSCKRSVLKASR